MADDLGYSDLGAFGSEIPTPNLDQLAREGQLLTHHYVNPTCSPTRASLMSGTDNHLAGLGTMAENLRRSPGLRGRPGYEGYLNEQVSWLPELLRDAGYSTAMVGKWHLGRDKATWPIARGFEQSFAALAGGGSHFGSVPGKPIFADRSPWVQDDQTVTLPQDFYSSTSLTDRLLDYLKGNEGSSKPFFAYAAYTAPHWPLHAPDEDIARFKGRYDAGYEVIRQARLERQKALGLIPRDFKAAELLPASADYPSWQMLSAEEKAREARKMEVYAAMVHNLDRNIGRLVQYLKASGQFDNTLIVFMSDNGAEPSDSFFPNNANTDNRTENIGRPLSNVGYGARWAEVSATPFRYFKGWTGEGGIASPAFVRLPGAAVPARRLDVPTHVTDIAPTVLALAGIRVPQGDYRGRQVVPMTGESLLSVLTAPQANSAAGREIAGELFGGRWLIDGRWKLVSVMQPFGDNQWQLFDIASDRGETRNVAAEQPDVVARLTAQWQRYADRNGVVFEPNADMPDLRWGKRPIPESQMK
ncbi:arylsulfatase [Azoarcus sp. L1K30]|nr:arylsulfatase [Azoarcus sp. L1K30]